MSGKISIGVTGKTGVGKTSVVSVFESFGVQPIYSDKITHKILQLQRVKSKLEYYFGKKILQNGEINRGLLAKEAFKDRESWKELLLSTHPYILKRIFKTIETGENRFYAIDAPLLFESGLDKDCDFTILVKASPTIREKRLKNLTLKEAMRRTSLLIPDEIKEKLVDFVIINNQTKRRLNQNVKKIWNRIKNN